MRYPNIAGNPRKFYRWGLLAVFVVGVVGILSAARVVLLPFLFAIILAYFLAPLVELFVKHRIHRVPAILLSYALVVLILAATVVYMVPLWVQETGKMIHVVPTLTKQIQLSWNYWLKRFHQAPIPGSVRKAIDEAGIRWENKLFSLTRQLVSAVFGVLPGVLSVVVSPILAFYLLKDMDRIRERFWQVVPIRWHAPVYVLALDVDRALNGFIRGQLLVALFVGILSGLWVGFLGIPLALLIGAIAALTDVIPYVGPIAGAVPAVMLGLEQSPIKALYAVLGFVAIHQLEGTVIGPKIMGDSVGLHPLVVIFAILVGGEIGGLAGLLLAVPTAAVVKVILGHLYRHLII
ncbi:MAG: AI-2E family transporter [Firmicutes bacterium]|uniref:AI-2E family transporter n=1 Tax=Sulfobacillus benefaciens TaxID=453960 RepID=A0A2T2WX44_9FIRM|nr:AI-2E family transporter [Bacillota bacterium]MCL5014046.1 AI-2E family transporter [Bacillota bacterium]PSR26815.1 MAG: AI-2E family transporter [Sulfobacillus benefaciens]HBQ95610.1 AI-2E family transporter [Sulfobacillus sp.]